MGCAATLLHSFGRRPNLVLLAAKMPEVAHRPSPSPSSLCHPPPPCFTYPAIAALAAPRGIPGEGSEGKRAKRRMGARPALQMGLRPPPTRISIG